MLAVPGDKLTYPPYHVTYLHFYNNNLELLRATCAVAHPEGTKHSPAMWPLTGAEGTHHGTELLLQNKAHLDDSEVNGEGKER